MDTCSEKAFAMPGGALFSSVMTAADYRLAIEEFDHLWESGATGWKQQRMRELLELIEPFENGNSGPG